MVGVNLNDVSRSTIRVEKMDDISSIMNDNNDKETPSRKVNIKYSYNEKNNLPSIA